MERIIKAIPIINVFFVLSFSLLGFSQDYPGAVWTPASPNNYVVGNRKVGDIDRIIIHTTEASNPQSTIKWFQESCQNGPKKNPSCKGVSSHYLVDSNGIIYQFVLEKDYAQHAGAMNTRSIGIEHVGFPQCKGWSGMKNKNGKVKCLNPDKTKPLLTDEMIRASAMLVRDIASRYGIPLDRKHIIGHDEVPGTHSDPGVYWNWDYFMSLVRGESVLPPISNPPPPSSSCKASPKISVKPKSGFPGTPFTVSWKGFSDNGTLISHLQKPDGTEYPTKTFTVDRKGKAEFVIDSSTFTPGQYNLWAEDTCTGKRTETVSFTIKGSVSPPIQPPPSEPGPTNNPPQIIELSINPSPATVNLPVVIVGVVIDFETQDQNSLSYLWSFGEGTTSTERVTAIIHYYTQPGFFNVCLTVTDPQGLQAQKCQQLQVIGESISPSPPPSQPIDSDNDGIPDNQDQCPYQWGPAPTGCPAATQPPPSPPPAINQPPWAQITVFPTTVNVGELVTIKVVSYGDPEGQPLVFDYDFGDGTVIPSPADGEYHSYSQPGVYTVRAKVRDPQGAFSYTNSFSVTVIGLSSPPPSFPPPPPPGGPPLPPPGSSGLKIGDVDQNGVVNEDDLDLLGMALDGFINLNSQQRKVADIAYPCGTIDWDDWALLLDYLDFPGVFSECHNSPIGIPLSVKPSTEGISIESKTGMTIIEIYNAAGQLIYQFEEIPPHRRWQWDMRDQYGTRVPNGVYLAVITVRDLSGYSIRREVRKVVVLR